MSELCFTVAQTAAPMDKNHGRMKTGETYGRRNLRCNHGSTAGYMRTVGIQTVKQAVCFWAAKDGKRKIMPGHHIWMQWKDMPTLWDGTTTAKRRWNDTSGHVSDTGYAR